MTSWLAFKLGRKCVDTCWEALLSYGADSKESKSDIRTLFKIDMGTFDGININAVLDCNSYTLPRDPVGIKFL
jgi:hypothetical protein